MMLKRVVVVGIGVLMWQLASPVLAVNPGEVRQGIREEVQERIREQVAEKAGSRPGLLRFFTKRGRAAIGSGTVSAVSGTTLTVTREGKTYTVLTDDKTQFRRRFWGKASLAEIKVGHLVNIIGLWTDENQTTIEAKLVRDLSIQKRFGVFIGTVKSLLTNGWTMQTARGLQTVTVSAETKFINRTGVPLTQADIAVGHRVRVKGLWDRTDNTITEVTQVKDYDLPPRPTVTVTPTPTTAP